MKEIYIWKKDIEIASRNVEIANLIQSNHATRNSCEWGTSPVVAIFFSDLMNQKTHSEWKSTGRTRIRVAKLKNDSYLTGRWSIMYMLKLSIRGVARSKPNFAWRQGLYNIESERVDITFVRIDSKTKTLMADEGFCSQSWITPPLPPPPSPWGCGGVWPGDQSNSYRRGAQVVFNR